MRPGLCAMLRIGKAVTRHPPRGSGRHVADARRQPSTHQAVAGAGFWSSIPLQQKSNLLTP